MGSQKPAWPPVKLLGLEVLDLPCTQVKPKSASEALGQEIGVHTSTVILEITMAVHQKTWNQSTIRSNYTTLGHILKGFSIIELGNLLNYVYSSFVCNSQNVETI